MSQSPGVFFPSNRRRARPSPTGAEPTGDHVGARPVGREPDHGARERLVRVAGVAGRGDPEHQRAIWRDREPVHLADAIGQGQDRGPGREARAIEAAERLDARGRRHIQAVPDPGEAERRVEVGDDARHAGGSDQVDGVGARVAECRGRGPEPSIAVDREGGHVGQAGRDHGCRQARRPVSPDPMSTRAADAEAVEGAADPVGPTPPQAASDTARTSPRHGVDRRPAETGRRSVVRRSARR